ncbi:MAG: hypothetical protein B6U94_02670 [Thermofilum sp. ex4484_79]|nr:MAG: hypothetical protein B6U94_02670 [Thermofilum sp. ex4484_79]
MSLTDDKFTIVNNYNAIGKSGLIHSFDAYIKRGTEEYLVKRVKILDMVEFIKILAAHIDIGMPIIILALGFDDGIEELAKSYKDIIILKEERIEDFHLVHLLKKILEKS